VGPADLLEPVAPLAAHRRAQGLTTAFAKTRGERKPRYLLVVGDEKRMPPARLEFYRWRAVQAKQFASDAVEGVIVGRIPASTPEQVAEVVRKTLAYEKRRPSPNDLRLVIWGGAPGYGGFLDAMATGMLVTTVRQHSPLWLGRWMVSADPRQALCGWPPDQPRMFDNAMALGSVLNAVVAHANADAVFSMRHEKLGIWYQAGHARAHMTGTQPAAPLLFLACNCGEFDRDKATIAEKLLLLPAGPVATVGATTESHPLTNYFSSVCLLKALGGEYGHLTRLGDLWGAAQLHMQTEQNKLIETMLKDAEGKLEPQIDVGKLRRDQARIYALLGDPALLLPIPGKLEVKVEGARWTVTKPEGATALHLGFRAVITTTPAPGIASDAEAARKRFEAAMVREAFTRRVAQAWSGEAKKPGVYRFVAVGPWGLRAAAVRIDPS